MVKLFWEYLVALKRAVLFGVGQQRHVLLDKYVSSLTEKPDSVIWRDLTNGVIHGYWYIFVEQLTIVIPFQQYLQLVETVFPRD